MLCKHIFLIDCRIESRPDEVAPEKALISPAIYDMYVIPRSESDLKCYAFKMFRLRTFNYFASPLLLTRQKHDVYAEKIQSDVGRKIYTKAPKHIRS